MFFSFFYVVISTVTARSVPKLLLTDPYTRTYIATYIRIRDFISDNENFVVISCDKSDPFFDKLQVLICFKKWWVQIFVNIYH